MNAEEIINSKIEETKKSKKKDLRLHVSKYRIEYLPDEVCELDFLESLDVSGNKIHDFPIGFFNRVKLKKLIIKNNQLFNIPNSVFLLDSIEYLDVSNNELLVISDDILRLNNLKYLDVSHNKIYQLPEAIGCLDNLETLIISHNQLEGLPDSICNMTKLKIFTANNNMINNIPENFNNLYELEELELSNNRLVSFDNEISGLEKLFELNLIKNNIRNVPSCINELIGLRVLKMSFNNVYELPDNLYDLVHLEHLDLSNNYISYVSDRIGCLVNLKILDIAVNLISSIPDRICDLIGLRSLNISRNKLKKLPEALGNLTELRVLNIGTNELTEIPEYISRCNNLEVFSAGNNHILSFPVWISELKCLHTLNMNYNKLTEIGNSLSVLRNLKNLNLEGNNLVEFPQCIFKMRSLTSVNLSRNNIRFLKSDFSLMNNLKILNISDNEITELSGFGLNVSKLRTLDLRGNNISVPDEILDGYNNADRIVKYIHDLEVSKLSFDPRFGVKQLDEAKVIFVGEAKNGKTSLLKRLRSMPFSINEVKTDGIDIARWDIEIEDRMVRLNVWDLGGQEIYHATHQFFLTERTLYVLVLNSRQSESQNRLDYWLKTIRSLAKDAPILIVQNHYEENPQELNRKLLKEKYPTIKFFAQTSCVDPAYGISHLLECIKGSISDLLMYKKEIPGKYFQVKNKIEETRKDMMSYDEYEKICQNEGLEDKESQRVLIRLLHELGTILNFNDFRLEDTNVLNPKWVTEGVYRILDYGPLRSAKNAILKPEMLNEILPLDLYPRNRQRFIVQIMEKFELCFHRNQYDEWLVPELLLPEEPDYTGEFTDSLSFEYHYDFLPSSILPRLIVRTHHYQQLYTWLNGVVVEDDMNCARIRADVDDKKILIEVSGAINTRRDLLSKIRDQFSHIHYTMQGMNVEGMIPIPGYPNVKPVPYAFMLQLEDALEETFRWEGIPNRINVSNMLNGIEYKRSRNYKSKNDREDVILRNSEKKLAVWDFDREFEAISGFCDGYSDNSRYIKELSRVVANSKMIPFVGAGLSFQAGIKLWIPALESFYEQSEDSLTPRQAREFGTARTRFALEEAAQILWDAMGEKWFNDRIKAHFGKDVLPVSNIKSLDVSILPAIALGPVITTNFDALLENVYGDFDIDRDVVLGDYGVDKVLDRFDSNQHFLVKLHGDADESAGRILTKLQYDRAYNDSVSKLPTLLRAIFSSRRPLLFIGCSLETDRTVEELRKVGLQMHNAYHFALLKAPVDEGERRKRQNYLVGQLGIQPIWMRDYDDIRPILEFLAKVRNAG